MTSAFEERLREKLRRTYNTPAPPNMRESILDSLAIARSPFVRSAWTTNQGPVPSAQLNQKTILIDTGANIALVTTYAGMEAYCTTTGSGFTAGKGYKRNAANTAWSEFDIFENLVLGDVLYVSAARTLSRLGIGSAGQVLTVSGGVPVWAGLSGTVKLINADETAGTDVNTTTIETTSKTYTLAANSYTSIIAEGEVGTYSNFSSSDYVIVKLYIGATVKSSQYFQAALGVGANGTSPLAIIPMKLNAALAAGGTIKITVQPSTSRAGLGSQAYSLRVYGVV